VSDEEISEIWVPESNQLLIALSGFGSFNRAWEPFNFMALTRKYQVNRIFLRDLRQTWYHCGIAGLTKNIDDTAEYLTQVIGRRGIEKVVVLGTSAGGYAGLIIGWLIEAAEVHVIVPQSFIDAGNRVEYQDLHKDEQMPLIYDYPDACSQYFDVKPVLEGAPNGTTEYHIYYPDKPEHDRVHAERLAGIPDVNLHRCEKGGHVLASYMTRDGSIDRIIQEAFGIEPVG
jgi:hypothetical protein